MAKYQNIVILTGAGLSAESGLQTFRDPDGVWAKYDWRVVATPQGFKINPQIVHEFYNRRRRDHQHVAPNIAHRALARLEAEHGGATIVTQNIDGLHEAAGSKSIIHMHGELLKALCVNCEQRFVWEDDISLETCCPACRYPHGVRPDVVWFGEVPYHMERIATLLAASDLFISIGTSGNVYPAAGFVTDAKSSGAHTVELNLEPSEGASSFDEAIYGKATDIVPAYVERLLKS